MAAIFITTTILEKNLHIGLVTFGRFPKLQWLALWQIWFAVTAFSSSFRIKIPHTNLIENLRQKLVDNLGNFVVSNFLSPQNIRPYIQKLKISNFLGDWLQKEKI